MCWALFSQMFVILLMPDKNWLDDRIFWIAAAVCGTVSTAVLGLLSEEFKRAKIWLLAVFFFGGVLGQFVAGHINEVYDFSASESCVAEVEDLDHSRSRRNSDYYCTVTLPDGREERLNISRTLYQTLQIGDPVRVEVSTGSLGIEYVNAYPVE